MTGLERRYTRWMQLFYPVRYRRERGSELVGTYLAVATPGRERPSAADVLDLASGGLQQHLRLAPGLGPGARLAGLLALATATALATGWTLLDASARGPWSPLGFVAWAAWLLAAVAHAVAPGRWYRRAAALAVLLTVALAVMPAAALPGWYRPPLFVLVPQVALGVVALGAAGRPWWIRPIPVAAAVAGVPLAGGDFYYERPVVAALPAVAAALLLVATLLTLVFAARRDHRGGWALLILLTPIGMLALNPLGALFDRPGGGIVPQWPAMLAASALVAVIGPALAPLALAVLDRLSRPQSSAPDARCRPLSRRASGSSR